MSGLFKILFDLQIKSHNQPLEDYLTEIFAFCLEQDSEMLIWVKKYLGESAYKRLILSHHKDLNAGDFLVDDRDKNGAAEFAGEFIHFGQGPFPDWLSVKEYLLGNQ